MHGSESHHESIRSLVCTHLRDHPDDFAPFLEEPLATHVDRMSKKGVFGGHLELVAFSRLAHCQITIHQGGTLPFVIDPVGTIDKSIHIVYHSYEHYSSTKWINGQSRITVAQKNDASSRRSDTIVKQIQKVTGEPDLNRIRGLLEKHRGKFGAVVDALFESEAQEEEEEDSTRGPLVEIKDDVKTEQLNISAPITKPTKPIRARDKKDAAKKARKQAALDKKRAKSLDPKTQVTSPNDLVDSIQAIRI